MGDSSGQTSSHAGRILVCIHDDRLRNSIRAELAGWGYSVRATETVELTVEALSSDSFDVCLVDESDAILPELAVPLQTLQPAAQALCLSASEGESERNILPAVRCDFLSATHTPQQLATAIATAVERSKLVAENRRLRRQLHSRHLQELVGTSAAMKQLRERVQDSCDESDPVLIQGEPGTGTNLLAQSLHAMSRRAHRPFIRLDCSLLSAESLERELFGNRQVSDSGFHDRLHLGRIEHAAGGTLLLDNIEEMALPMQKKLLAVVQRPPETATASQKRLNGTRLIAATHANLPACVEDGRFNRDLYCRFNGCCINTPPLRNRRDDIALLSEHFLNRLAIAEGRPSARLSLDALEALERYEWPGNLRELQGVFERACALSTGARLTADMIVPWLSGKAAGDQLEAGSLTLREMERRLIETTFERCDGNRERTAQLLKIGVRTLSGKLREYGYPPRGGPRSNAIVSAFPEPEQAEPSARRAA